MYVSAVNRLEKTPELAITIDLVVDVHDWWMTADDFWIKENGGSS